MLFILSFVLTLLEIVLKRPTVLKPYVSKRRKVQEEKEETKTERIASNPNTGIRVDQNANAIFLFGGI